MPEFLYGFVLNNNITSRLYFKETDCDKAIAEWNKNPNSLITKRIYEIRIDGYFPIETKTFEKLRGEREEKS